MCARILYGDSVVLHLPKLLATWIWIGLGWCFWGEQIRWSYLLSKNEVNYNHFAIDDAKFFFSFWTQSIHIKPVSWPTQAHDSPPNPILPYFQYMQLTLTPQKSQKLCGNPNIWLGSWGTYGVGEEWPRIPCPSSTFPTSFYTRDHNKPLQTHFAFYWVTRRRPIASTTPIKFSLHFISILSPNAKYIQHTHTHTHTYIHTYICTYYVFVKRSKNYWCLSG